MKNQKIYFAGPDVFKSNASEIAQQQREIALHHGFAALIPTDNEIDIGHKDASLLIFKSNAAMIVESDVLIANMNSFRGMEPDSGTVWEIGFGYGLSKRVIAYIDSNDSILQRMTTLNQYTEVGGTCVDTDGSFIENFKHPLNLMLMHGVEKVIIGNFKDAVEYLASHPLSTTTI